MNIAFSSEKFRKECNDQKRLERKHGQERARKIRQRLDELSAAQTLSIMRTLPGRTHELTGGKLKGCLSIDLDGPYRLIFEPVNEPSPVKEDGGLDWTRVTSIRVIEVKNTHE